jgi:hypothetical protein
MRCTISQIYFDKELYTFRTDLLSIVRSLNTVYTAIGIYHTSYVDWLLVSSILTSLADSQHNEYDKYLLLYIQCWGSWWWTVDLSETCRVLYQNKYKLQCISSAFTIRIYHDAKSSECVKYIQVGALSASEWTDYPTQCSNTEDTHLNETVCIPHCHKFSVQSVTWTIIMQFDMYEYVRNVLMINSSGVQSVSFPWTMALLSTGIKEKSRICGA